MRSLIGLLLGPAVGLVGDVSLAALLGETAWFPRRVVIDVVESADSNVGLAPTLCVVFSGGGVLLVLPEPEPLEI